MTHSQPTELPEVAFIVTVGGKPVMYTERPLEHGRVSSVPYIRADLAMSKPNGVMLQDFVALTRNDTRNQSIPDNVVSI